MLNVVGAEVPHLVPVRMLNEFVYCERLFYLEWVQSQWAENADTAHGTYVHRRVDKPAGAVPGPEDADELRIARSISLSCDELGLIGVVDVLEGDHGEVVPVEVKKGKPPDNDERAWLPERVQVCALVLLLRSNGYRCTRAALYFDTVRRRVDVVIDDELVEQTLTALSRLRTIARHDIAPAPLVDSPKCPRCSLVGICLPDEIQTVNEPEPLRTRLLVPDDDRRPVYVAEHGASVSKKGGRLVVTSRDGTTNSVRFIDVSQLSMFGNVQISSQAIAALFQRDVPMCWFSYGGWFRGIAHGMPSKHVQLRLRQAAVVASGDLDMARASIAAKIRNGRTLLMRNADPRPKPQIDRLRRGMDDALWAESTAALLGVEGAAARTYWSVFDRALKPPTGTTDFDMNGRNRRPPRDRINCLLSYCASLLVKDCTTTLLSVGFDPYMGYLHRPRFGRPALALDLAEEFRPLIAESVVITVVNNGEITESDFIVRAQGVSLTKRGRQKVIGAYERRLDTQLTHPVFGYKVTYRRAFELQARLLAATMLRDTDQYVPLVMR